VVSAAREAEGKHGAGGQGQRDLHEALVGLLGEVHAGTLMEYYLVPAPWTVLARLGVPVGELVAVPHAA
jgi:hypothetical protein